jgi:hypothetical protein
VAALAVGGAVLALAPALWIVRRGAAPARVPAHADRAA